ncbi:hypothetical protein ACFLSF_02790 [Candidatus Bipolaricaulota bacterium]
MGKCEEAVRRLGDLGREAEEIKRRLERIPGLIGSEEIPRNSLEREARARASGEGVRIRTLEANIRDCTERLGPKAATDLRLANMIAQLARMKAGDTDPLGVQIAKVKRALKNAGPFADPDPALAGRLHELEAQRDALTEEFDALTARLDAIPGERVEIIQEIAEPAWTAHVKAKQNAISKGVKLGREIRESVRQYERAADRAQEAAGTVESIKAVIFSAIPGGNESDVFGPLRRETPEPCAPTRKLGENPSADAIAWRILTAVRTACESAPKG